MPRLATLAIAIAASVNASGAHLARAQLPLGAPLQTGEIIPDVTCAADASQHYALYLPREYSPERSWPLVLAFDPGGRGRTPVERYQAAAERYGYIVAGSNNSRNGSTDFSRIIEALTTDVLRRFRIDQRRVYTAGMSGGARVALMVALETNAVAGVIASSAGYPDSKPRKTLPFAIFATAGTEDFNHLEMRRLDEALTSPHRLAVFEGGHTWLSSELATEAIEWMELRAMLDGRSPRDSRLIDALFAKRAALADATLLPKDAFLAARAMVDDFTGLKDVSKYAARAAELERTREVRSALTGARDEDTREEQILNDVAAAERRLASDEDRAVALMELRRTWKDLSEKSRRDTDSAERRIARRALAQLSASTRTADADYLKIINEYRVYRAR